MNISKLLIRAALCLTGVLAMNNPADAKEPPECIKKLAEVSRIQTEHCGEGAISEIFPIYAQALKLRLAPMGEELSWLIKNGSPAGKVYACFIAWEMDPPGGIARFESVRNDTSPVKYQSGCKGMETTVGEIANEFLAQHRYMDFPTHIFCKLPIAVKEPGAAPHLPPYLETLKSATLLANGAVGEGGSPSPDFLAYKEAMKHGAEVEPQLNWLVDNATPAGRLYAACLLYRISKDRGVTKLKSLQNVQTTVKYGSGCEIMTERVCDIATELATKGIFLDFDLQSK